MTRHNQQSSYNTTSKISSFNSRLTGAKRVALIGCATLVATFALGSSTASGQGAVSELLGTGVSSELAEALDLSLLQNLRVRYQDHETEQQQNSERTRMQELKAHYEQVAESPLRNALLLITLERQIRTLRDEMVESRSGYQTALARILTAAQRRELAEIRERRASERGEAASESRTPREQLSRAVAAGRRASRERVGAAVASGLRRIPAEQGQAIASGLRENDVADAATDDSTHTPVQLMVSRLAQRIAALQLPSARPQL